MSPVSKSKKRSKGLKVRQHDDRMTNLPSSFITKILSCLPTKQAVGTCVLSKKWKRSWTSLTNLDFCDYRLRNPLNDAPDIWKFTSFATWVLLLRDRSCLQRVTMTCYCKYDNSLMNAWLIAILQCNVQELDITFCEMDPPLLLPSDMFLSSTLVVLKLDVRACVIIPTSVRLPSLKTLHLAEVELADDVSLPNLLSASPVLEELKLHSCVGSDVRVVNISARVLKNLIIKDLTPDSNKQYKVLIDTPALEYFYFGDDVTKVDVVNMNHLIEAKIKFEIPYAYADEICQDVQLFLDGISEAKNLVLSLNSMRIINSCIPPLPKFEKLIYLKLNILGDPGWKMLPKLLENSPCLESLYLKQRERDFRKKDILPFPFHVVPSCFHSHLKKIEIEEFEYKEDEMMIVEYILKNAKVLEKLTLHYQIPEDDNVKNHAVFLKELLSLPRASDNCKVVVCD